MGTMRTPEREQAYRDAIAQGLLAHGCVLCSKVAVKTFRYWKIVENDYPYDLVAGVHHMIIPLRHVTEVDLTSDEREEFEAIKESYLHPTYEYLIESTHHRKSIPSHFHLHLLIGK